MIDLLLLLFVVVVLVITGIIVYSVRKKNEVERVVKEEYGRKIERY